MSLITRVMRLTFIRLGCVDKVSGFLTFASGRRAGFPENLTFAPRIPHITPRIPHITPRKPHRSPRILHICADNMLIQKIDSALNLRILNLESKKNPASRQFQA